MWPTKALLLLVCLLKALAVERTDFMSTQPLKITVIDVIVEIMVVDVTVGVCIPARTMTEVTYDYDYAY